MVYSAPRDQEEGGVPGHVGAGPVLDGGHARHVGGGNHLLQQWGNLTVMG